MQIKSLYKEWEKCYKQIYDQPKELIDHCGQVDNYVLLYILPDKTSRH